MTFIIDGLQGLTFPNSTTQASAGKIIQTVYGSTTTITTTTSSAYTATSVTASITPKFSTSTIYIIVSGVVYGSVIGTQATLKLYRNSSDVGLGFLSQVYGANSTVEGQGTFAVLDSPATTSSTTYTVYLSNTTNIGNALFPQTGFGNIILMEIAA